VVLIWGSDTRTERLSIVTPWPHDGVHFSIRCSLITNRALFFGRFPGYARLSFRTDQHLDKDDYGALMELQGKTVFREKRVPLPLWPTQIPRGLIRDRTRIAAVSWIIQCVPLATEPGISLSILYCNEIWTGVRSLCEKRKGMCL